MLSSHKHRPALYIKLKIRIWTAANSNLYSAQAAEIFRQGRRRDRRRRVLNGTWRCRGHCLGGTRRKENEERGRKEFVGFRWLLTGVGRGVCHGIGGGGSHQEGEGGEEGGRGVHRGYIGVGFCTCVKSWLVIPWSLALARLLVFFLLFFSRQKCASVASCRPAPFLRWGVCLRKFKCVCNSTYPSSFFRRCYDGPPCGFFFSL